MASSTKPCHVPGNDISTEDNVLETGASLIQVLTLARFSRIFSNPKLQNFEPTKQLCAHLNAFHTYADEPGRYVEANHYCAHLTEGIIF